MKDLRGKWNKYNGIGHLYLPTTYIGLVTILCHFMVSCLLLIFDETMLGLFLGMIIYDGEFLACDFIVLDICS